MREKIAVGGLEVAVAHPDRPIVYTRRVFTGCKCKYQACGVYLAHFGELEVGGSSHVMRPGIKTGQTSD